MAPIYIIFSSGLYFYIITILTQYGFNSYFGIPANLIEASIRDNIIFSYTIFKTIFTIPLFFILIAFIFIAFIGLLSYLQLKRNFIWSIVTIIFVIGSMFVLVPFGRQIAEVTEDFTLLSNECISSKEGITYIVPAFYQTKALVVPIHTNTNKLTGSFFMQDISGPECEVYRQNIGKILK